MLKMRYSDWIEDQWDPIPATMWHYFAMGFLFVGFWFLTSVVVGPYLWGPNFDLSKRKLWHSTFCCVPFQIVYTFFMIPDMIYLIEYIVRNHERPFLSEYKPTEKNWQSAGAVFGYVFWDLLAMLVWKSEMQKGMGKPLWLQMVAHHFLLLLVWPYAFCSGANVPSVVYFMFTESTSPFMNIRWLSGAAGWDRLWVVCTLCFALAFTLIRIVPAFPLIYYSLQLQHQWGNCSYLQMIILGVTGWVPFYLNFFWYSLIIKGARKFFAEAKAKKET